MNRKQIEEDIKWFGLPSRNIAYDLYSSKYYYCILLSTTGTELRT